MSSNQIYRMKLFLNSAVRNSDSTQRYMWFSAFPHIPLTNKGNGLSMGKGAGNLSSWCTQLSPGIILVEFNHLRYGSVMYFLKQVAHKSPVQVQPIISTMGSFTLNCVSRASVTLIPFN